MVLIPKYEVSKNPVSGFNRLCNWQLTAKKLHPNSCAISELIFESVAYMRLEHLKFCVKRLKK